MRDIRGGLKGHKKTSTTFLQPQLYGYGDFMVTFMVTFMATFMATFMTTFKLPRANLVLAFESF